MKRRAVGICALLVVTMLAIAWPGAGSAQAQTPYQAEWVKQIGTPSTDECDAVAVDPAGNVYIAGWTGGTLYGPGIYATDAFVSKYDPNGNLVWANQFGSYGNDKGYGVAVSRSGNVYVAGWTDGTMPGQTGAGLRDAFLSKFDVAGNLQWSRQLGTANQDYGYGVAVDTAENVYFTGSTGVC